MVIMSALRSMLISWANVHDTPCKWAYGWVKNINPKLTRFYFLYILKSTNMQNDFAVMKEQINEKCKVREN